ncbi:Late competence development protein ComFB [Marinospirillum celere]|uniref:Late competence development protein ComFB n=1 Tax=Marinospirillum celere TaxID=1122252 RepID=A0A1I1FKS9_9GAMM|nr:late competence development ComFB family protein [Marinospirillum celere]SFB98258.1 Late competence development protein ComFB [Marinospirillum celere]
METENVHNYYETALNGLLTRDERLEGKNQDFIEDVICLTLNQLPAFYVRFDVDTTFYMSEAEMLQIEEKLKKALDTAIAKVEANPD